MGLILSYKQNEMLVKFHDHSQTEYFFSFSLSSFLNLSGSSHIMNSGLPPPPILLIIPLYAVDLTQISKIISLINVNLYETGLPIFHTPRSVPNA